MDSGLIDNLKALHSQLVKHFGKPRVHESRARVFSLQSFPLREIHGRGPHYLAGEPQVGTCLWVPLTRDPL